MERYLVAESIFILQVAGHIGIIYSSFKTKSQALCLGPAEAKAG
jgi:hypothetical protein